MNSRRFTAQFPPVPNERNSTQRTAALRDFDPAYVSSGSIAPDRHARDTRALSASPSIAIKDWHRSETTRLGEIENSFHLALLPMAARYSLAHWAHLRWTRMLLGRGAGNPLLRGGLGFRPVRTCRNHMNDLVAAAFELVENFGQREDRAGMNVVQQQDAPAARLDTSDRAFRNLAITAWNRHWDARWGQPRVCG